MKFISLVQKRRDIGIVAALCGISIKSAQDLADVGVFTMQPDGTFDMLACAYAWMEYLDDIREEDEEASISAD